MPAQMAGSDAARAGVERMKVFALALTRAGGLVNLTATFASAWHVTPPSWPTLALAALVTAESLAVVLVCRRAGRLPQAVIACDAVFCCAAIFGNHVVGQFGPRGWAGVWMYPFTIVASAVIGVAFRRLGIALAATGLLIVPYVIVNRVSPLDLIPSAFSYVAITPISWGIARAFERYADALDAARAETERRTAELARERERARHARMLHDRSLQTLEAMARGDWLPDRAVRDHVAAEAAWLRAFVENADVEPDDLLWALRDIVARKTREGLRVDVHTQGLDPGMLHDLPAEVTRALAGAVNEALTNVLKHAGVRTAVVRASSVEHGIAISVVDHGRGYDVAAHGFGVPHSIRAPIEAAGGSVRIDATPGQGTRVGLWVPCAEPAP